MNTLRNTVEAGRAFILRFGPDLLRLFLLLMVAAFTLDLAAEWPWPLRALLIGVLVLAFILVRKTWRRRDDIELPERLLIGWLGLAVGVALTVLWVLPIHIPDGLGLVGFFVAAISAGGLMTVWRDGCAAATDWKKSTCYRVGRVVLMAGLIILGFGYASMVGGWNKVLTFVLTGVGLAALVVGSSACSEVAIASRVNVTHRAVRIFGGLLLLVVSYLTLVTSLGRDVAGTAMWISVLAFVVWSVTANPNFDGVALFLAGALLFTFSSTEAGDQPLPAENGPYLVALGDSFMSGEGSEKYFSGTSDPRYNACRRSPTAYMVLAAPEIEEQLVFVGCSGAERQHIVEKKQFRGEPVGHDGGGLPQIDHVRSLGVDEDDVSLALVSVGGNDASFGEVGRTCVLPGNCAEFGQVWLDRLEKLADDLAEVYESIGRTYPSAQVVAVPYPVPLISSTCAQSTMTSDEHRFLVGYASEINRLVTFAAAQAEGEVSVLSGMAQALSGIELCNPEATPDEYGTNFVDPFPSAGSLIDRINPLNWLHNSLHPNEIGHAAMLRVFLEWYPPGDSIGSPLVAGSTFVPTPLVEIMGDPSFDHCKADDPEVRPCTEDAVTWMIRETAVLRWPEAVLALLAAIGAWLIWVEAIAARRSSRQRARGRR